MRENVIVLTLAFLALAGGVLLRKGWGTNASPAGTEMPPAPTAVDKPAFEYVRSFGSLGTDPGQFQGPFGIAISPDEHLYLADDLAHRVSIFDTDGKFIETLGSHGSGPGQFSWVDGLSFSADGRLWVADTGNHRIQIWRNRKFEAFLDLGTVRLENPRGILAIESRVLVADYGRSCVRVFSDTGRQERTIGTRGHAEARLRGPIGIAIGPKGHVYVSDLLQHAILVYHPDGTFIQRFGSLGNGPGELNEPHGIAFGPDELLYVADHGNHRVATWTTHGQFVNSFSGEGTVGATLRSPTDLCFGGDRLYVVDKGNHRVCTYQLVVSAQASIP